jgi:hypothetical protein
MNNISWKWSTDYKMCTATITCKNNADHSLTFQATVSDPVPSSVDGASIVTYTATFTYNGVSHSTDKPVNVDNHEDDYQITGDPVWTLVGEGADAHYEVTANFECSICHKKGSVTETAYIINSVDATCFADGSTTYQVKWTFEGTDYYKRHEFTTPQLAHDAVHTPAVGGKSCTDGGTYEYWYCNNCKEYYSDAACATRIDKADIYKEPTGHTLSATNLKWAWADDFSKATATTVCTVCGETVVLNATITSVTSEGKITYTAKVTVGDVDVTDVKEEGTAETKLSDAKQEAIDKLKLYAAENNLKLDDESVVKGIEAIENAEDDTNIEAALDTAKEDVNVSSANAGDTAQVSNGGSTSNGEMIALIGIGVMIVAVGIVMIILVSRRKKNS